MEVNNGIASRRSVDFSFGIGEPRTRQSSVWRVWNNRSDLYVAGRKMGHIFKLSLHESSQYLFWGITREHAVKHLNGKRGLRKWKRSPVPPSGLGRASRLASILFPTDYLGPDRSDYHGIHWIPTALPGLAIQVDLLLTLESRQTIENAFTNNGRRLEEYVRLPNGQAFAAVSSIGSEWRNRDLLLRGGPDFSNVAFLARDPKGADRSVIYAHMPPPKDGDCHMVIELWGNPVPADFPVPPTMQVITGGPNPIRNQ